ncbi:MAG: hypothetical protein ACRDQA_03495 [Nocardioidaceae bacterium]
MGSANKAMRGTDKAAAAASTSTRRAGQSMATASEGADRLAGGAGKAGGALIGIGQTVGGPFGAAMQAGGVGLQFMGDAGDIASTGLSAVKLTAGKAAVAIKSSTIATKASAIATKAYAVAQRILNLAMKANPILLIISLIVLLVAAVIVAYKKSATFRRIVQGAWSGIKKVVSVVVAWFQNKAWPTIKKIYAAITSVNQNLIRTIQSVWHRIRSVIASVAGAVQSVNRRIASAIVGSWHTVTSTVSGAVWKVKSKVVGGFNSVLTFLRSLKWKIASAARGAWGGITDAFRSAINNVVGMWNRLHFTIPSISIPGIGSIGGGTIYVPQIPYLASGGIITSPTVAMVGEAGPEAVIPLDKFGRLGSNNTYHITVNVPVTASPADVGRGIVHAVEAYEQVGGKRRAT